MVRALGFGVVFRRSGTHHPAPKKKFKKKKFLHKNSVVRVLIEFLPPKLDARTTGQCRNLIRVLQGNRSHRLLFTELMA